MLEVVEASETADAGLFRLALNAVKDSKINSALYSYLMLFLAYAKPSKKFKKVNEKVIYKSML